MKQNLLYLNKILQIEFPGNKSSSLYMNYSKFGTCSFLFFAIKQYLVKPIFFYFVLTTKANQLKVENKIK